MTKNVIFVKPILFFSFQSEDVPICHAASERHIEVLDFLLAQKLNHDRLLSNRKVRLCLQRIAFVKAKLTTEN